MDLSISISGYFRYFPLISCEIVRWILYFWMLEAITFRRFYRASLQRRPCCLWYVQKVFRTSWKELLLGDVPIMILLLLFPFLSTLHFLSCATRPLLFLDGTFVKNKYKGTLLGATGKNGNQGFFPLAFALVDAEDEANWTWFLMNLSAVLSEDERTITFISDRHKGLLQSVANVFPTSPHGFCIYHIEKNIKTTYPIGFGKKFRKKMVQLFKNCAYSSTPEVFDVNLQILRKKGGGLIDKFLEDLPKENYSDAFFLGARYGEMWSNVAESFNSWIRKERLLPIFQLVESIRVKLMVMNAERRIAAEKWNSYLCPEMENQLDKLLEVGRHWHISRSSEFVFEVRSDDSVMVDLEKWYCSCCQWQIKGFLAHTQLQLSCTTMAILMITLKTISQLITISLHILFQLNPDIHQPPIDIVKDFVIKPPVTRKQPGRPRVKRIKSNGEESRPMKCGRCKKLGHHNKNTCSAPF